MTYVSDIVKSKLQYPNYYNVTDNVTALLRYKINTNPKNQEMPYKTLPPTLSNGSPNRTSKPSDMAKLISRCHN